jgi:FLYWCH zinc finger domain
MLDFHTFLPLFFFLSLSRPDDEQFAVFSLTMRGKEQLIYQGQPFIFEKLMQLGDGKCKKIWRCNQWWNEKCRARVFTIDQLVTPLNKFHTHEDIIKRKRRTVKKPYQSAAVKSEQLVLQDQQQSNEQFVTGADDNIVMSKVVSTDQQQTHQIALVDTQMMEQTIYTIQDFNIAL